MAILTWRSRGAWVGTLGLLCLAPGRAVYAQASAELEYRVKAAYLLNFARYTEWPSAAFPGAEAPINLCIIGRDPFGLILDQTLQGRRTAGRQLRLLRPPRPGEALCHVAFLGAATPAVLESWLTALATEPTLTVGESHDFARAGGMIAFVIVDETVRFEINTDAVRVGGLQLSSRLLSLATRLLPERTP